MDHLAHWTVQSGLGQTMTFGENGRPLPDHEWATLSATHLPDAVVELEGGATLKLGHTLGVSGDRVTESALRQDFSFRVDETDLVPIPALMDRAGDLQDLISIAVDAPAAFTSVKFWHPDLVHERVSDPIPIPYEFIARWGLESGTTSQPAIRPFEMVFTLPEMGGLAGVARWLAVAVPHRSAIRRVTRTRGGRSLFTSDLLLNRAAALESFDRTRTEARQAKFKTRLRRCVAIAGDPFQAMIGNEELWLAAIKRERDGVAHHDAGLLADGAAQHYLAESAYWLFVLCMMRIAGLTDDVFERLGRDQRFTRLRRELPATY